MSPPTTPDAFDRWDEEPINELIARARAWRGKTQDALVDALCDASGNVSVDRSYISRWENGRRIPTPYWRRHLATVLGIPEDVLDRAVAIARARRDGGADAKPSLQSPQDTGTALTVTWAATPGSIGDAMNRAQFLSLMGATAAGAFAEEAFELLRFTETLGPSKTTVSILEQTVNGLDEAYCSLTYPATQLVGPVGQHVAAARKMLSGSPGAQRERLCAIASQAATMLGCLAYDLHDPHHARLYLHTAEQAAHEAGHPALASYAISNRALHALTFSVGDPQTAARLARQAQEVAARSAPEPLRAWLAGVEARALADLGDAQGCEEALDIAATAVAGGRSPGALLGGMTFFAADRLAWYAAICHAHLGETETARSLFADALAGTDPKQMPRLASIRLEIATTFVQEGDPRQATNIAIQALDEIPRERQVAAVTNRAKRLDAQLTARWPSEPAVREFHEHLMTA